MNRRVLDNVVISALDKHADEDFKNQIFSMFSLGELVEDARVPVVSFDKSMLGLSTVNLSNTIRKLALELKPNIDSCLIIDSNGNSHEASKEAVSILKALAFYRITCPLPLFDCITNILSEIDEILRGKEHKELVSVLIEDSKEGEQKARSNINLMKQCRTEVFSMLKEAGLTLG